MGARHVHPDRNANGSLALRFALKCFDRIIGSLVFTCFNTGLAGSKLDCRHKAARATTGLTVGVLAAFVAEPVFPGTDFRGICPASEVEAMTGSNPAVFRIRRTGGVGTGVTVTFPPGEFEMQPDTINAASTSNVQAVVRTKGIFINSRSFPCKKLFYGIFIDLFNCEKN